MDSMAKLIGYNHTFSSVYHSLSNGMIERFNATFVPQIAKLQDRENNNWGEFLLLVVFAYNTGIHATTNYSPFQLQFGRESCLPTDELSTSIIFNKPNDYYKQLKKRLLIIQRQARANVISRQQQYKNNYDKRRSDPHYEINDSALPSSSQTSNNTLKTTINQQLVTSIIDDDIEFISEDKYKSIPDIQCITNNINNDPLYETISDDNHETNMILQIDNNDLRVNNHDMVDDDQDHE
ncbi:unnamed protein product [Rotaria sordida]|uniref:Integrase catalytic domain-containing protein n=1 Tax=Rotaria sordida TaxID=392033 RepID=A0A814KJG1_9BILA|nr:unnamed protein product [Rotaria sordida]CAF1077353.1 unnamed protein product [Rotaria sordida]CAF3803852.1 unnamed protein product [Rotaria sordida]CAF3869526.1 unnamed protein product [Rotaria sordida]